MQKQHNILNLQLQCKDRRTGFLLEQIRQCACKETAQESDYIKWLGSPPSTSRLPSLKYVNPDNHIFTNKPLLCVAAEKNRLDLTMLLIEKGANPLLSDGMQLPIHIAASNDYIRLVQYYMRLGVPHTLKNQLGDDVIACAAKYYNTHNHKGKLYPYLKKSSKRMDDTTHAFDKKDF